MSIKQNTKDLWNVVIHPKHTEWGKKVFESNQGDSSRESVWSRAAASFKYPRKDYGKKEFLMRFCVVDDVILTTFT